MSRTKIEWCKNPDGTPGEVWNVVTGCTKVSAGCRNCYAARIAGRFWGERKFTDVMTHPERLKTQLRWWKKPRRVFVNSMADLFHEKVPNEFIAAVFGVMAASPQHTFIILTKRPKNMISWFQWINEQNNGMEISRWAWAHSIKYGNIPDFNTWPGILDWPLPNVWLGVSVEDSSQLWRIDDLLQTPAAVRLVSVEPMLEGIDLSDPLNGNPVRTNSSMTVTHEMALDAGEPSMEGMQWGGDDWEQTTPALDWIIAGCESGPGARHFEMDWARSLRDQCQAAGVPFFFKQGRVDGKLVKMPALDGQVWDQYPVTK